MAHEMLSQLIFYSTLGTTLIAVGVGTGRQVSQLVSPPGRLLAKYEIETHHSVFWGQSAFQVRSIF